MPTFVSISIARAFASFLEAPVCLRNGSPICRPTEWYGDSAVSASWKIIAILLPRSFSSSLSVAVVSSLPSRTISPSIVVLSGLCRPRTVRLVTDFPDPDSPTMPRVVPRSRSKERPSTALASPSSVENRTCRSRTERNASDPVGAGASSGLVRVVTAVSPGTTKQDDEQDCGTANTAELLRGYSTTEPSELRDHGTTGLRQSYPRIDHRVQGIDDDVQYKDERGADEHHAHQFRQVLA